MADYDLSILIPARMDFKEVVEKRRSVRQFQGIDVPNKDINEIIELARKCPSAGAIRGMKL